MLFKTFGAILVLYWSQSASLRSLPEATEPRHYKEHVTLDTNKQMTNSRTISSNSRAETAVKG